MESEDVSSDRYDTEAILKFSRSLRKFYANMKVEETLYV
jgi:hypothetical protein